jgi:prolyl oligopeptidase
MLFTPSERVSLSGVATTKDSLLLATLDNVRGRLYRLAPGDSGWSRSEIPLPGPGSASFASTSDESEMFFFSYTDFLTPSSLYLVQGDGAPELVKSTPTWFDAAGMKTTQYEATSKDDTRIPYFVVTPAGFTADGNAATVLYGYGGFEVPELPFYSGTIGSAWLSRGGVFVLANIRGGGEFGPRWHDTALKENRHKVYEDFIAVAEDLVARKITSPRHLGIMGGSQGGLLVAATFLMRPDLFNAVVSEVPLMDMKRYNKLLAGASWMAEYGNPDIPEEWAYIKTWSPYQMVRPDVHYPEVFIWTTTRDDRVHPGHARKMAAKMLDQGHDVLYYENTEGGHGSGTTNQQRAYQSALEWAYLWKQLR